MPFSEDQKKLIKSTVIQGVLDGVGVRKSISKLPFKVSEMQIFNWLNEETKVHDREFFINYVLAQQVRAEAEFDEILEIADARGSDVIEIDGKEVVDKKVIQRDRLRVDTRKWRMAKMQPNKYGHKVDISTLGKPITEQQIKLNYKGEDLDLSN